VPGFTGFSGGWSEATYELGDDYADEKILLAFRYSTDWGSAGSNSDYPSGWAFDNVEVGSTTLTTGTVGSARSIQEIRGAGNRFTFEFLTWDNGDAITVTNVHTVSLSAAMTGTLDLTGIAASDTGFDEAGERGVIMVSLNMDVFEDLIGGGVVAEYADYNLTGLPPSICTSDVDAYGDTHKGAGYVYAGEVMTAAVHADNLGSSPNLTATAPATFYIGVELPVSTTFDAATSGTYTNDLSTVAGSFPADPGVYWTGPVTRVKDIGVDLETDAGLMNGDVLTAMVHYASDATGSPEQYFTDEDTVEVVGSFGLSTAAGAKASYSAGSVGQFVANLINLSGEARDVELTMNIPPSTTLAGFSTAGVSATAANDAVIIQTSVKPYAVDGAKVYTLSLNLDPDLQPNDVVTSTMQLEDLETRDVVDMESTITIGYDIYLPLVAKEDTAS
jgi:hypothetical protein